MKPNRATENVRIDKESFGLVRRRARQTGRTLAAMLRVMVLSYESFTGDAPKWKK